MSEGREVDDAASGKWESESEASTADRAADEDEGEGEGEGEGDEGKAPDRGEQGIEKHDIELLMAWRAGDKESGTELFERHYPSIARFFHNKVPEPAQDDLIQETFKACVESASKYRGDAQFRTYLFGIAHHVLADYVRRTRPRAQSSQEYFEEMSAEDLGPSPVTTAVQHQDQRLLLEALRRIPLIHQIALELFYWEELTAFEIAEVLGVRLGTAKTRLRDGRGYLVERLHELARSPKALQSTLDNLDRWAQRMREQIGPPDADADDSTPVADDSRSKK